MDFKTTDGMTICSANVIKTDIKFKGKGIHDIACAKAKIDNDRKWHTIAKSSQRAFADFALRLQSKFMSELDIGLNTFSGFVPEQVTTDNVKENDTPDEPSKKVDPLIFVESF